MTRNRRIQYSRLTDPRWQVDYAKRKGRKFVVFPIELAERLLNDAGWPRGEHAPVEFETEGEEDNV